MNDEYFQTLLARVLDDEATSTESDELIAWLRQDPAAGSEVRKHLQLWELYSQQIRAERASDAFAEACHTRLLAETGERKFVRETEQRLRRSVEPGRSSLADRVLLLRQWVTHWLLSPRWVLTAAVILVFVFVLPGFLRPQGVPELASFTGTQIQILRGGRNVAAQVGLRLQPNDVIQTTGEDRAIIGYGQEATWIELDPNSELKFLGWKSGKRFSLVAGKLEVTVTRQRSWRPMILVTGQAEAQVLGTTFTLMATTNATRLEVTEGKVRLTRTRDDAVVEVPAGYYAVTSTGTELAALPFTGSILREYWTNLPGDDYVTVLTSHLDYPDHPSGREYLDKFEAPSHWGTNYGARIYGYLHPPKTGKYKFWIAADGSGELWLSPDDNPETKRQIGYANRTAPFDWTKHRGQQSSSIDLVAGRKYYIEVFHKQGTEDDHLAVAWQVPGREREVIPGKFLSPFKSQTKEKKR